MQSSGKPAHRQRGGPPRQKNKPIPRMVNIAFLRACSLPATTPVPPPYTSCFDSFYTDKIARFRIKVPALGQALRQRTTPMGCGPARRRHGLRLQHHQAVGLPHRRRWDTAVPAWTTTRARAADKPGWCTWPDSSMSAPASRQRATAASAPTGSGATLILRTRHQGERFYKWFSTLCTRI